MFSMFSADHSLKEGFYTEAAAELWRATFVGWEVGLKLNDTHKEVEYTVYVTEFLAWKTD